MGRTPQSDAVLLADGTEINTGGETTTATIALGAALSGVIDKRGRCFVVVHVPAAITAASLGLKAASAADGTFVPVYDKAGDLFTVTLGTSRAIVLDPQVVSALRHIKLWSQNGSGTDTNQEAARTFNIDLF